jgi:hypothetical protein
LESDAAATIGRVLQLNESEEGPGNRQMRGAEGTGDGHVTSNEPALIFSAEGLKSRSVSAPRARHQEITR